MSGISAIEWAVASKPIPGVAVLGDAYLVAERRLGALLAVADGLGHGPEAAEAAERAVGVLKLSTDEDIPSLLRRCDLALKHTRGAVLSLATMDFESCTVEWAGIGNVEGILLRRPVEDGPKHRRLAPQPGVLGDHARTPRTESNPLCAGDTLVFVTDGIVSSFADDLETLLSSSPERIARHILEESWRGTDDALVLVARYKGE
ncbi:MAG: SpoIIE family protein phosphatase [Dehalococcoidia bacterium]